MTAALTFELRAWQRDAIDAWTSAGRRGVVEAVTGTGKTAVGIAAAADAVARGLRVLVAVPSIALLEQWHRSIRETLPHVGVGRRGGGFGDTFAHTDVLVSTVQSAIGNAAPRPDGPALLIADEVHRYGSDSYSTLLTAEFDERLGLTATFERNDSGIEKHLLPYFERLIPGCDYPRGYAEGILAPVRVMLVSVPFTPEEQCAYDDADEIVSRERFALTTRHGCREKPFGEFMRDVMLLNEGGGDFRATWSARRYLKAFGRRRAILAESRGKLDMLRGAGSVLANSGRSIVFSETKESAALTADTMLDEGVPAVAYTSDLSTTERADLLEQFRSGVVGMLAAPRVLDEGVDVPEADVGIILASSHSRRQMIQRMGRVIRPKADGRHASFVVAYIAGSSEDPERGAHHTFLEQLTSIAAELVTVDATEAASVLASWLADRPATSADEERDNPLRSLVRRAAETDDEVVEDLLLACLSVLPPDGIDVLVHRFGIGGSAPLSREDTADVLGMSRYEVTAAEETAFGRLAGDDVSEVLVEMSRRIEPGRTGPDLAPGGSRRGGAE